MDTEKALLAAIWEQPHDDTPRLVYADWLDEHGQPEWAEFIRTQVELATFDEWDESPRKSELRKREKQLVTKHGMGWKAGLPAAARKRAGFHRGFPYPPLRNLPSARFLKLTEADFAGAPLWTFRLPPNNRALPQVLAIASLLRVGTLDLRFWLECADDVRQFVVSPHVRNVADLNLSAGGFGDAGVRELAAGAGGLPNLRRLNMEYDGLTEIGVRSLAGSALADRLEALDLSSNPIGPDGIETLADSPRLGRLKCLDLSSCEGRGKASKAAVGKAMRRLCESPHLAALKALKLYHVGLDDTNVAQMCQSRPAFRLAELSLMSQYPRLADAGAAALAAWPGLASVRQLNLGFNEIGAAGGLALARSPHLGNVTELNLELNPVRDNTQAMAALRDRFGKALRVE